MLSNFLAYIILTNSIMGDSLTDERDLLNYHPKKMDSTCSSRSDGVYAEVSSRCKKFYVCNEGKMQVFSCSDSQIFDPMSGKCKSITVGCFNHMRHDKRCIGRQNGFQFDLSDHPMHIRCDDGDLTEFACPKNSSFDTKVEACTSVCPEDEFDCKNLPSGYYLKRGTPLNSFYYCTNEIIRKYVCPAELEFNFDTLTCTHVQQTKGLTLFPVNGSCKGQNDGIYISYQSNCRSFFTCANNTIISVGTCPHGWKIDWKSRKCTLMLKECSRRQFIRTNLCQHKSNGVYPLPNSECSEFYKCKSSKVAQRGRCPTGSAFDVNKRACKPKEVVPCSDKHLRKVEDTFGCSGRKNGLYPDYIRDCRRYVNCEGNLTMIVHCPGRHKFSTETMTCFPEEGVVCNDPGANTSVLPQSRSLCTGDQIEIDYKSRCRKYTKCVDGVKVAFHCPRGMRIHPKTGQCDYRRYVICYNPLYEPRAFKCPTNNSFDEYIPDVDSGCTVYHKCYMGISRRYRCPENLVFSRRRHSCDLAYTVLCDDKEFVQRQHVVTAPSISFTCIRRRNGYYADYSRNCMAYFKCINGKKRVLYCSENGRMFNEQTSTCDFKENVLCEKPAES